MDLDSARENVRPRRYHNAVFFGEQAAEKGLKAAYWHLLAEEPGWNHQLDRLATALGEVAGGIPDYVSEAITGLLAVFETTRYPSPDVNEPIPADLIAEGDAKISVAHAEKVMIWVESLLKLPTGKPKHKKS